MGLIIAAEAAKTQLRLEAYESSKLEGAVPGGPLPRPEKVDGLSWDLDSVVSNGQLLSELSAHILALAKDNETSVEGVGIAVTGSVGLGNMVFLSFSSNFVQVNFNQLFNSLQLTLPNVKMKSMLVDSRSKFGAWGEYRLGWRPILVQHSRDLFYIAMASAIGGGIVINGELWQGVLGIAGEIGHLIIDPTSERTCPACGRNGCASVLASGRALVQDVIEQHAAIGGLTQIINAASGGTQDPAYAGIDPAIALRDVGFIGIIEEDHKEQFDARAVLEAWQTGASPLATYAVNRLVNNLAKLITEVAYILDPSIVVIGGIASAAPTLATAVSGQIQLRAFANQGRIVTTSYLGDRTALVGAALMCCERIKSNGSSQTE